MRKKSIYIVLVILTFSCNKKVEQKNVVTRTTSFPKEIETVNELPDKDDFWIFVLAGQSNMAGRGLVEPNDTITNKRVLSITKDNQWVYAKEPLHFYEPNLTGLDCGLSFANTLLSSVPQNITIGILPCAVGGSAIEQWIGDSIYREVKLLTNFKNRVDFAKQYGTIKGVLWHQGESNAKPELIDTYEENLKVLFSKFRSHIENDSLPILIGELGAFKRPNNERQYWDSINKIINDYSLKEKNVSIIKTGDLDHKGDDLHFNSKSQRIMGERFAEKYLELH